MHHYNGQTKTKSTALPESFTFSLNCSKIITTERPVNLLRLEQTLLIFSTSCSSQLPLEEIAANLSQ